MKIKIETENGYLPKKYSKYAREEYKYKDNPIVSFPIILEDIPENTKSFALTAGVRMIQTNEGGEFNPQIHNAMSYIQSQTIASGRIAQIYQHGYMYNDRILRPAMVLISK